MLQALTDDDTVTLWMSPVAQRQSLALYGKPLRQVVALFARPRERQEFQKRLDSITAPEAAAAIETLMLANEQAPRYFACNFGSPLINFKGLRNS